MKLLCWNCQGVGSPLTVRELQALVDLHRPTVLFLIETKNQEAVIQRLKKRLHFPYCKVVNPRGTAGGLAIFWDARVDLVLESYSEHYMHLRCKNREDGKEMQLTFLHAPYNLSKRLEFWDELRHICSSRLPWVCLGDFNEVLFHWEKKGARLADRARMTAFRDLINDCSLMDLESKGCAFTWSNNREGLNNIKERLDRALCTVEWRMMYPEAEAIALPALGSDHSPLLISLQAERVKRHRTFKFESFWLEKAECRDIIKAAWEATPARARNLPLKLKTVTEALLIWSRRTFTNGQRRILNLKQELQALINSDHYPEEKSKAQAIKGEIEEIWKHEEMYWGLRSRIQWLKWGDRNTKFFHATTIQRRQRNHITRLKTTGDSWVSSPNLIKRTVEGYYQELYLTEGHRDFEPVLDQCPVVVTDQMNLLLLAEISEEEIKSATFQMGAEKAPGPDGLNGLFYQKNWETLKEDIVSEVKEFFKSSYMLPELNQTSLVLISKIQNPESLDQYCPISLCNFGYKIIAKVLANRLKPLLPQLIAE